MCSSSSRPPCPGAVRLTIETGSEELAKPLLSWASRFASLERECPSLVASLNHAHALLGRDREALAAVASSFAAGPRRLAEAAANEDAGRAFAKAGERGLASKHYLQALRRYEAAGAQLAARRVRTELRSFGSSDSTHRRTSQSFGWESLTDVELSVTHLVAEGLTNRQVGEILFMSRYTVDSHLRHIFNKFGIHSRVALVKLVLQPHREAEQA
jgi:DNA-binding CsgD family transcriptional regulator